MLRRLRRWWSLLNGSLWFVPGVMIAGAVLLAVVMIRASDFVDRTTLEKYPRIFGAGAQSSRDMLSTIATSMMTVASVSFSITILALVQASTQYTPRILRNFMRDRPNQVTLGTLTGVFVYCLIVIRTIRGDEDLRFIPAFAVLLAFVLAILGIAVLVYFIHHIASSLQAGNILARVRVDTIGAIDRLFPDELGEEALAPAPQLSTAQSWRPVLAPETGYITHLDEKELLDCASARDLVIRMERGIGDHVIAGTPLVSIAGPRQHNGEDEAAVLALFEVAPFRTIEQDAAFGLRQMVDIAVKALSPGVNDTSTAVASIDEIGAALVRLARRRVESPFRSRDGVVRVLACGPTFDSLVHTALDEIRTNAGGNVRVLRQLLSTLEIVTTCTRSPGRRHLLREEAQQIVALAERTVADARDRIDIQSDFERIERI